MTRIALAFLLASACAQSGAARGQSPTNPRGFSRLEARCDHGDAQSCSRLAEAIIARKTGVPADSAVARALYTRGCDVLHDAANCASLAQGYRHGWFSDTGADLGRAADYAELACKLGRCNPLAWMLIDGEGVAADRERGQELFRRECDAEMLSSCLDLLALLRTGTVKPLTAHEAADLLRKVCAPGYDEWCRSCVANPGAAQVIDNSKLVSGDLNIRLPPAVVDEAAAHSVTHLEALPQLCIDETGQVACVLFLKKTGYTLADQAMLRQIKAWRFLPHQDGGKPTAACAFYLFSYEIKP